jgi:hypothetical protein
VRRLVCLFREHRFVTVRAVDIWTVPDVGPQVVYEEDDDGDRIACRRCRRVWPLEEAHAVQ